MRKDRLDHHRIFDTGDDAQRAAAVRAGIDVDAEHALKRCAQRIATWCSAGLRAAALAECALHRQDMVTSARCEHAMVAPEVHPWPGHQRGEPGQKVQLLEHDVGGAVVVRRAFQR